MNNATPPVPRPVALVTVLAILGCFALFLVLVCFTYVPKRPPLPQNSAPEHIDKDDKWETTPEGRVAWLNELRSKQQKQAESYGWVDQKAGIVQLPIERAMELVVRDYHSGK